MECNEGDKSSQLSVDSTDWDVVIFVFPFAWSNEDFSAPLIVTLNGVSEYRIVTRYLLTGDPSPVAASHVKLIPCRGVRIFVLSLRESHRDITIRYCAVNYRQRMESAVSY
jgi:hypothetical protein